MTAANTPITKAIELASWPASPLFGAPVVAAAVGAEEPVARELVEVLACWVVPGARLVVAEMVGELKVVLRGRAVPVPALNVPVEVMLAVELPAAVVVELDVVPLPASMVNRPE